LRKKHFPTTHQVPLGVTTIVGTVFHLIGPAGFVQRLHWTNILLNNLALTRRKASLPQSLHHTCTGCYRIRCGKTLGTKGRTVTPSLTAGSPIYGADKSLITRRVVLHALAKALGIRSLRITRGWEDRSEERQEPSSHRYLSTLLTEAEPAYSFDIHSTIAI
jgi:hypothetical protein